MGSKLLAEEISDPESFVGGSVQVYLGDGLGLQVARRRCPAPGEKKD